MEIIAFLLVILLILAASTLLYREFNIRVTSLEKRIHLLEKKNILRMPHKAQDNILDVIAIVSDVLERDQDLNLLEKQRREREARNLEDALQRLKNAMSAGTKREIEGKED